MITVGLDFGTHQTKICVERKEGIELEYSFVRFEDTLHKIHYTLPSIIGIGIDGLLSYGYLPEDFNGQIIKYFKQKIYYPVTGDNLVFDVDNLYYSTWYIAYILFDLEERYGKQFAIQMGVPTDNDETHMHIAKVIATRVIVSAYKLVEEVFENDKSKFLNTPLNELEIITDIVPYSNEIKDDFGLLIFPEAYACLKPLISQGKLVNGMSLMVDIGGGTTDISFFTIENNKPQVYDFYSINKGLNYLTLADDADRKGVDVNVHSETEISPERKRIFFEEVGQVCKTLRLKLEREFKGQTKLNIFRLNKALENRPLVYCGGGSTFNSLRITYSGFIDKKQISHTEWQMKAIKDIDEISAKELCPILSTAYGLSISTENDDIPMKPFKDIFSNIRGVDEENEERMINYKSSNSYKDNWLNKDYGALSYSSNSAPKSIRNRTRWPNPNSSSSITTNNVTSKPEKQKTQTTVKPPKQPTKNVRTAFYNVPFKKINNKGLDTHDVIFTTNTGKIPCQYYGNVRIINGYAYDLYKDNGGLIVIDVIRFINNRIEKHPIVAVEANTPLYNALQSFNLDDIVSVSGKLLNKINSSKIQLTIKSIDSETGAVTYNTYFSIPV